MKTYENNHVYPLTIKHGLDDFSLLSQATFDHRKITVFYTQPCRNQESVVLSSSSSIVPFSVHLPVTHVGKQCHVYHVYHPPVISILIKVVYWLLTIPSPLGGKNGNLFCPHSLTLRPDMGMIRMAISAVTME